MLKNNFYFVFFGIFSLVATILGTCAYLSYENTDTLINKGIKTYAIMEESIRDRKGHVRYKLKYQDTSNKEYIYWMDKQSWTPDLSYGEKVDIFYNPKKPNEATCGRMDAWFVPGLLSAFFIIFGLIGYIGLGKQLIKRTQRNNVRQNGIDIKAHIDKVYENTSVSINNEHPYIIRCTYKSTIDNKVYVFHSDNIWFDPTPYLKDTITVRVNPNHYNQYAVDTSFLTA